MERTFVVPVTLVIEDEDCGGGKGWTPTQAAGDAHFVVEDALNKCGLVGFNHLDAEAIVTSWHVGFAKHIKPVNDIGD